jgi:hypothetical protein
LNRVILAKMPISEAFAHFAMLLFNNYFARVCYIL